MRKIDFGYGMLTLSALLACASCQNNATDSRPVSTDSSYFSIRQFAADQIQLYRGSPFSLYRISRMNGAVDSTVVNFMNMDWASIFHAFSAADISARKYLGKYSFSAYDDATTGNRGYTYTANDPKLFTRSLQINTDPSNNKITSIYIETAQHDFFGGASQKLLYIPLHIIQIQETERGVIGKARNLRVDYRFMQEDAVEQL